MTKNTLVKHFAMRWRFLTMPFARQISLFFPDWLVAPNLGLDKVRVVHIDKIELSNVTQIKIEPNTVVDVVLTQECCLKKTINLPAAAAAHVSAVVDVFLRQSLPASGQGMQWRTGTIMQQSETKSVTAYVLKNTLLEKLAVHVENNGGRLRQIRLQTNIQAAPFVDNIARISRPARIWVGIAFTAYLGVCGFLATESYQTVAALENDVRELQLKRSNVADEAATLTSAQQAELAVTGSRQLDLTAILAKSGRSRILAYLTTLIPADIWLSEFSLIGSELRVSGRTKTDVVGLISTLQGAEWIKRATLDGPVIPLGSNEGNSFELIVELIDHDLSSSK